MMNRIEPALLRELTGILQAGAVEDAALEAKWILEDAPSADAARQIAMRRAKHEPLQYLLGQWEFYGLRFAVGAGVLIPRADTETLVDAALERLRKISAPRIADLCTGTGCIAAALKSQRQDAQVCGVEISEQARTYAERNMQALRLDVQILAGDVLDEQLAASMQALDCIVSNPPYLTADDMQHLQTEVTFEPALALDGGADGLHFYRNITRIWKNTLKTGGLLAFEAGIGQADPISEILAENGLTGIETVRDLNGIERVVLGYRA